MDVGFLIYGDINTQSGGYLYDRKLLSYLQGQGDRVEVISLAPESYVGALFSRDLPEVIGSRQFDILIQDELVYPRLFNLNARLKTCLNCPIVSLVHLLDSSRPQMGVRRLLAQMVERRYLNSIDGLILNSRHTQRKVCDLLSGDLPASIIAVPAADHRVPAGLEAAQAIGAKPGPGLNLLYVGNVIRQKGLHVLLQALEEIDRDCYRLTVAGRLDMEPAYVKQIRRQMKSAELEPSVQLTGPLRGAELTLCYQQNDVLVLPSVNEAYGIVYIEAQGFGLPVIGTHAGGASEIIKHGTNGYLIDPGDYQSLAKLLTTLSHDRARLKLMSSSARDYYRRHPTWADSCGKIRDFLINTIRARGQHQS
jgi:glycosyltransferase involved in cell wall biosynthesis